MKGTLIMICGLPGSGKTTLSKKLEKERNAFRFCPDKWINRLLKSPKDTEERDRIRTPVEQIQWEETQKLLDLGVTVILENGFWPRKEREEYRKKANNWGVKVELHYVNAPMDIITERIHKRNQNLDHESMEVSLEELPTYHGWFEEPTDEEGQKYDVYVKYYTHQNIEIKC
ncbi:MAG: ATP-binding protein [Candidatus Roizmanbacteria bacterium]